MYALDDGYEFRDSQGQPVDWKLRRVWRHHERGYLTRQKEPVFLHKINDPVPVLLCLNGREVVQHPTEYDFWRRLLDKYED